MIPAAGKHIIAEDALAGGDEGVGINKSAQLRIVITGLEVVQAGFSVEYVATIGCFARGGYPPLASYDYNFLGKGSICGNVLFMMPSGDPIQNEPSIKHPY